MSLMGRMMKKTAKGFVVTSATAVAVNSMKKILPLPDAMFDGILGVGIPMMMFIAADDPQITDLLFKESKKKNRKQPKNQKEAEDEFFNIFGDKGHAMNKAIAEETGASEDDVNGVMGLFMPSFIDAVAEEEPEDANALGKMFGKESKEAKKSSPSLAKMTMKMVF